MWSSTAGNAITGQTNYTKGNAFQASVAATVSSFGMELDAASSAFLTLVILESSSVNGPYNVISQSALGNVPTGQQWHYATGLNVTLTPGMFYYFGTHWTSGTVDHWYSTSPASDPSWGTFESGGWKLQSTVPVNGWTPDLLPGGAYRMEIWAIIVLGRRGLFVNAVSSTITLTVGMASFSILISRIAGWLGGASVPTMFAQDLVIIGLAAALIGMHVRSRLIAVGGILPLGSAILAGAMPEWSMQLFAYGTILTAFVAAGLWYFFVNE